MGNIRMSPSFSSDKIKQAYVADLLLILSRKKAEFITEAILFFIANNDISKIPSGKNSKEDLMLKIDQAKFLLGEDWDKNYIIKNSNTTNKSDTNNAPNIQKTEPNDQEINNINNKEQHNNIKNNTNENHNNIDDFLDAVSAFY